MAETLYRKYRPQTFADIQGQSPITTTLTNQIKRDRIAHAYLFSGTRGTGKTTSARVFAKAINCHARTEGEFEPCGTCSSCTDITAGRSVDVIELDAATHTGVDTVREQIIENARFMPTRDKFKIFIIDEVHMLSTSSFNALLKSLEEPPAHVVYILATTELHKVPATVASRCQRFIFHPLPLEVMETKLNAIAAKEGVVVAPEVTRRILAASGGAMRDAESLLGQLFALGLTEISNVDADVVLPPTLFQETIDLISVLSTGDAASAFTATQALFESGIDLQSFHDALTRRAHELLVVRAAQSIPHYLGIFSEQECELLTKNSKKIETPFLSRLLELLIEKRILYRTISSPFIPLHLIISELTSGAFVAPQAPAPVASKPVVTAVPPVQAPVPTPTPAAPAPAPAVTAPTAPVPPPAAPAAAAPPTPPASDDFDMPMVSLSETAESAPDSPTDLEAKIIKFWPIATQAIIVEQPSLGIILAGTRIVEIKNATVNLSVQFPMYREKLMEIRVKNRVESRLSELCGTAVAYSVTHIPEEETHTPEVADALDTFGGRVVG